VFGLKIKCVVCIFCLTIGLGQAVKLIFFMIMTDPGVKNSVVVWVIISCEFRSRFFYKRKKKKQKDNDRKKW